VYTYVSLGTPVARIDRTGNATAAVEFLFHGLANNTLAAVGQRGAVNASFSYAPVGEGIESVDGGTDAVAANGRRTNARILDQLPDLDYYGARYYDKTSMTWTQGDPVFRFVPNLAMASTPRRAGIYAFSLNNPLMYLDPDGLDSAPGVSGDFFQSCQAGSVCA